jgi:hypothetical protein
MPIKFVHIFFIFASFLLTLGLAAWAYNLYRESGESFLLIYAGGSAASGVILFGYVIYFWRRMKGIK